jgi:hypothetical protein
MSDQTIPATAVAFPFWPVVASAMPMIVQQFCVGIDNENQQAVLHQQLAVENWLLANGLNREKGLPIQPKPVGAARKVANVAQDAAQTTYLWVTIGEPVEPTCPDLPPLPPPPVAGNISVGKNIALGWWAALPDDAAPDGATFQVPPGPNSATAQLPPGTYRKISSPFGGWWNKVA